jgi:hypothetical protein
MATPNKWHAVSVRTREAEDCESCGYPFDDGERALFDGASYACGASCAREIEARDARHAAARTAEGAPLFVGCAECGDGDAVESPCETCDATDNAARLALQPEGEP